MRWIPASTRGSTRRRFFWACCRCFIRWGLMGCLMIPLMLGSKVVYHARFSPVGVFEAVKQHGIEVLIMVPTMYAVMANAKAANWESLEDDADLHFGRGAVAGDVDRAISWRSLGRR